MTMTTMTTGVAAAGGAAGTAIPQGTPKQRAAAEGKFGQPDARPPGGSPLGAFFCGVAQWNKLPQGRVLLTSAVISKGQSAMTVVQIEKPEDTNLADWFAELRLVRR
jgi:hypothetical protein